MKSSYIYLALMFAVLNNIHGILGLGLFGNVAVPDKEASCHDLTLEEVQLMPGWTRLKGLVETEYGAIADFHVNWDKQPKYNSFVCAHGRKAIFGPIDSTECKNSSIKLSGSLGTSGYVTSTILTGFEVSSTLSVTRETKFGLGLNVKIEYKSGDATTKFGLAVDTSTTLTNTNQSSKKKKVTSAVEVAVRIISPSNKACSITLNMQECSFTGKATVPIIASGWVWFELDRKIKGSNVVGYLLETILSQEERGVGLPVDMSIDVKTHGKFNSECKCVDTRCSGLISE